MARKILMTKQRQQLIDGLRRHGGRIEANGHFCIRREELIEKLGFSANPMFFKQCEQVGIIKRKINGKHTKAIWLTKKYAEHRNGEAVVRPTEVMPRQAAPQRNGKRRSIVLPSVPRLGDRLEVFMQMVERDGTMRLGFRNDTESWLTTVEAHTQE